MLIDSALTRLGLKMPIIHLFPHIVKSEEMNLYIVLTVTFIAGYSAWHSFSSDCIEQKQLTEDPEIITTKKLKQDLDRERGDCLPEINGDTNTSARRDKSYGNFIDFYIKLIKRCSLIEGAGLRVVVPEDLMSKVEILK